MNTDRTCKECH